jgi:hypothetical protein
MNRRCIADHPHLRILAALAARVLDRVKRI